MRARSNLYLCLIAAACSQEGNDIASTRAGSPDASSGMSGGGMGGRVSGATGGDGLGDAGTGGESPGDGGRGGGASPAGGVGGGGVGGGAGCSTLDCGAVARFEQTLAGTAEDLAYHWVTVCLNRSCATADFESLVAAGPGGSSLEIDLGGETVAVVVTLWSRDGTFYVEARFYTASPQEGDTYGLWVAGESLIDEVIAVRYAATYDTTFPNGASCPPMCQSATLTPTVPCCPIDEEIDGCMHLGGADPDGWGCGQSCDFFCSTSWRVETDTHGCSVWRYDTDLACETDGGF